MCCSIAKTSTVGRLPSSPPLATLLLPATSIVHGGRVYRRYYSWDVVRLCFHVSTAATFAAYLIRLWWGGFIGRGTSKMWNEYLLFDMILGDRTHIYIYILGLYFPGSECLRQILSTVQFCRVLLGLFGLRLQGKEHDYIIHERSVPMIVVNWSWVIYIYIYDFTGLENSQNIFYLKCIFHCFLDSVLNKWKLVRSPAKPRQTPSSPSFSFYLPLDPASKNKRISLQMSQVWRKTVYTERERWR